MKRGAAYILPTRPGDSDDSNRSSPRSCRERVDSIVLVRKGAEASCMKAPLRQWTRCPWLVELGGSKSSQSQGGLGHGRRFQQGPAHEREAATMFSFRKSISNHLLEVFGNVRCGCSYKEVVGSRISKCGWSRSASACRGCGGRF